MDISQYINYDLILPLVLYSIGIAFYAVFIWKFYRFLAKRDIIRFDASKYSESAHPTLKGFIGFIAYLFNYIILVPVSTLLWFTILAGFILFMAKNQTIDHILLISMAIVAATRITAYYHEDLSKDLAKMLPFALLGIFIIDSSFFSLDLVIARFKELPTFFISILNYVAFAVILEFGLRIIYSTAMLIKGGEEKPNLQTKKP